MTTPLSAAAKAAQNRARHADGKYGMQPRDEADLDTVTLAARDSDVTPGQEHFEAALAEVASLRARLDAIRSVYDTYFSRDVEVGDYDATPEPEDVWRFDRDMRPLLEPPPETGASAGPGCCTSCDGSGAAAEGPCGDCRGTGHPHAADPACFQPTSPAGPSLQTDAPLPRLTLRTADGPARALARLADEGELDLNPPYQRGSLWSETQRQQLIRSLLMELPVPAVTLNDRWNDRFRNPDGTTVREQANNGGPVVTYGVIDGKQRIETIHAWTHDGFGVPASWFEPDSVESTYETPDGPYVRWSNLSQTGRTRFQTSTKMPVTHANVGSIEEEAELYLLLNGGGVAQTEADMANAARVAGKIETR